MGEAGTASPHVLNTCGKPYKVRETPKILGEKEQLLYIETQVVNTCKYIVNQITKQIFRTAYRIVLFFSIQHFGKLGVTLIKKLTDINRCLTDPANGCLTDV